MFDYYELFISKGAAQIPIDPNDLGNADFAAKMDSKNFIKNFNNENLKKSIKLQNECDEVTSIYINYPALLLRKKSEFYPNGRTSHRFKNQLRRRVTIIDKKTNTAVDKDKVQDVTEVDKQEKEDDGDDL